MNLVPVLDHPALRVLNQESILCAGDLHIGLEDEYAAKGVHMPSQTDKMRDELREISEGSTRLVLLGDIKHKVPGTSDQEHSELPMFFDSLRSTFDDIDVARGNHDVGIEHMAFSGVHIHPASGFVIDDVGFAHGHVWPSNQVMAAKTLVLAHNHPAVLFRDGVGSLMTERCWLRCRFTEQALSHYTELPEEAIIVPSLNPSLKGSPINLTGGKMLGPLLSEKMIDLDNAEVYLLDGIHLGKVKNLRVERPKRYER
ncbi:MAG TPA: metallophosphoesterase [Methanomassiliicoccales archaeon]|nr:metallophosphoesterase [Methanomassiliicoccales archaeon]